MKVSDCKYATQYILNVSNKMKKEKMNNILQTGKAYCTAKKPCWHICFLPSLKKKHMKIIPIIIMILISFNLFSQNIVKGYIKNTNGEPLPFANIYITTITDSTIINGTLSDIKGYYKFENKGNDRCILNVSYIGYEPKKDTIIFYGKNINHNIFIKKSKVELSEVEITSSSVKNEIDKKTLYITDNMKAKASSSLDMLKNVSELNVNTLSNKVTTQKDGTVKILINGIETSELELLSIKPNDIIKIEYYDIVPARYINNNIKAVINVITKKSLNGFNGLIDVKGAVTTGFNDDFLNLNYVHNNTKISLNYFFSLRDYSNKKVNEELRYKINNTEYKKEKVGQSSPLSYTLHDINLKIINKKDSNYIFQFEAKPFIMNSKSTISQNLNYIIGDSIINGSTEYTQRFKTFQPKFDLYFEKDLKKNKKIITDIFYSYFNSRNDYKINEISNDSTIMNISTLNNAIKHSITSECIFSNLIKKGAYNIGAKYFYSNSFQEIENSINNSNEMNINTQTNLFADLNKKIKKFSIYTKLGLNYSTYSETNNSFYFLSFTPALTISYSFSNNSQIRLNGSQIPIIPSLSQLSNTIIPVDNYIIFSGNSNLKPYLYRTVDLSYSLQKKKLWVNPTLTYMNSNKPFDMLYKIDSKNNIYVKTFDNITFSDEINLGLSITYKPFNKGFVDFNIYSELYKQRNEINNHINSNKDFFLKVSINTYYKKFSLAFIYKSEYDMLYGDFINTPSPYTNIELNYKNKNFLFGISVYYPLSDSWYSSNRTVSSSVVSDYNKHSIYDNGNMIVFHLRYNFSFGKKVFETKKQINNNDEDNGILKVN